MNRRLKAMILCLSLLMSCFVLPTEVGATSIDAVEVTEASDMIVQPMFVNINSFLNSYDILDGGVITTYSSLSVMHSTTAKITLYIEKYMNGYWGTIASWTVTSDDGEATMSHDYTVTGGTYRIHSYGYAMTDGKIDEMTTYTSNSITYYPE